MKRLAAALMITSVAAMGVIGIVIGIGSDTGPATMPPPASPLTAVEPLDPDQSTETLRAVPNAAVRDPILNGDTQTSVASSPPEPVPVAPATPAIVGDWLMEGGVARIAIQPCGADLCGTVNWTKAGDALGAQVLRAMKPTGPDYCEGTLDDPSTRRSYSSKISLLSADLLRVESCAPSGLCDRQTWTRAKN